MMVRITLINILQKYDVRPKIQEMLCRADCHAANFPSYGHQRITRRIFILMYIIYIVYFSSSSNCLHCVKNSLTCKTCRLTGHMRRYVLPLDCRYCNSAPISESLQYFTASRPTPPLPKHLFHSITAGTPDNFTKSVYNRFTCNGSTNSSTK